MKDRPTERVRVLLDGLTASAIVERIHPYYSGYQFEGEWLDALKESVEGELDDLDRIIRGRAGTVGAVDRLREYVANAPASSMGEMARAIVRNYCDTIEVEAGDPTGARRFAEHLEACADKREDVTLFGVDYTALPVDADGVPIHVGDVLDGYGKTIEVVELRYGRSGWVLISRDGNAYADCAAFTHHHAPTVEDVLREFADAWVEWKDGAAMMNPVETFAVKLRLAGEDA